MLNRCVKLLCLWICITCKLSYAQHHHLPFTLQSLTPDAGLSQATHYFRFEDSKGFMWIATNGAVNRFDGRRFKVYNLNRYFNQCAPLQQAYGFAEDSKGNVYMGSTQGLYVYHRDKDQFTLHKLFHQPDDVAMPITFYQGKIWCFNRQWQIATYDVVTGKVELQGTLPLTPISSLHIYASTTVFYFRYPFHDSNNTLWFTSENNVVTWNMDSKQVGFPLADYLSNDSIQFFSCSYNRTQNKAYWGTQHGLLSIDVITKKIESLNQKLKLGNDKIASILAYQNWLVFRGVKGLFQIIDIKQQRCIFHSEHSLASTYLYTMDRSGRIWMSEDGKGILIADFHGPILPKAPLEVVDEPSVSKIGTASFMEWQNGDIVTNYPYVFRQDKTFVLGPPLLNKLNFFRKIADTVRKGYWFFVERPAHNEDTLMVFVDYQGRGKSFMDNGQHQHGQMKDMQVLPDGRILCAMPLGLSWFIPETKSFQLISSLPYPHPFKINVLSDNRLGISYINGPMRIVTIGDNENLKECFTILPDITSFYIAEDTSRNRYWVGTNQGVYLLDATWHILKSFNANNGFIGSSIFGLLADSMGNAWCSHQHGMSTIDANTLEVINFDKEDGVQDWDFNNRSFLKAKDGTLYFGGVSGFNYIKPPLREHSFYKPEVYIDAIYINNRPHLPDTNVNNLTELHLSAEQQSISFHAYVKDLDHAHLNRILYRLKPADTTWKILPYQSELVFNNLASGQYTLELGVNTKFNTQVVLQKSMVLWIATPFYKTAWFTILMLLLVQSIVGYFIYSAYRRKQMRKREKDLATVQLASLEQQAFSSLMNPHFMFNSLNSIQHYINVQDRHRANKYLSDFASLIRKNFESAQHSFVPLEEELQNIQTYIGLEKMRFGDKIQFTLTVEPNVDIEEWMIPNMLLQPLLENAILHGILPSPLPGKVTIHISSHEQDLNIEITDNGVGITHSQLTKVGDAHKSRGTELIQKRLDALRMFSKHALSLTYQIPFPTSECPGARVNLQIPFDLYSNWQQSQTKKD